MSINPYGTDLFTAFYNSNDAEIASQLVEQRLSGSFKDHSPVFGAEPNKAGFKASVRFINSAFKQVYYVDRVIEQGDTVVAIWHAAVEHVGQFLHVPATGKHFSLNGITAYSLSDGKITGHWEQFDQLAMLQALDIIPGFGK
ncbi:ester cyclase [Enterobacter sp. R4-368]|uniref:ester cyclase n=1 Tax=Enterobacter sp. R4-368 TaxID=1166130 RepID=UPI00034EDD4D|nr:ester cyclase [Enterobacter sp. R4-368]AGN88258.1 hypothetical protein H650_00115 [Enterobacter sp. R4-368]